MFGVPEPKLEKCPEVHWAASGRQRLLVARPIIVIARPRAVGADRVDHDVVRGFAILERLAGMAIERNRPQGVGDQRCQVGRLVALPVRMQD